MKKILIVIVATVSTASLTAQPVLTKDSIHIGTAFKLYNLSNVNTANLMASGANVIWDLSNATQSVAGIGELQNMSGNPYTSSFPTANFAIKFTVGTNITYSLFNLSSTKMEEVGNNVTSSSQTSFTNPRTALVFPFTFNLSDSDVYQKNGQGVKYITNKYDAYGTLKTPIGNFTNVIRIISNDFGTTSISLWNISPCYPLFQANNNGFTLWDPITSSTGINEVKKNNLSLHIYPNPAANEINIITKETASRFDVYNISGSLQISSTLPKIDISELSQGIYFIKAYSVNGISTQKFIKQ